MKSKAKKAPPKPSATKAESGVKRAAPPPKPKASLRDWGVPLAIAVVTFVVFLPALSNQFVHWDDDKMLLENEHYRGLGAKALSWMFSTFHMGHYQPLSWITLAIDYKIWGMEPLGYHLTNLLLHMGNAVLFYFLARRLLALSFAPLPLRDIGWPLTVAAALAALFFAVHPLRVESVAWATERRDVLSGAFSLATVLSYLRVHAMAPRDPGLLRWRVAVWACYILSLLSKAGGMMLPVVLLVLDFYPLRRLGPGAGQWFGPAARRVWIEKVPFFALAMIIGVVALSAQSHIGAMTDLNQHTPLQRLAQGFYGLKFYLWKTLWPTSLSPLYEIPIEIMPLTWPFILSAGIVLAITSASLLLWRKWPALLAVWLVYGAILGPVLGVAQSGPQMVADRYSYLSCLGWALLFGAGAFWCWRRSTEEKLGRLRVGLAILAVVVVLVTLSALTWQQTQIWRDTKRLWGHAIAINRNALFQSGRVQHNLGLHLVIQGEIEAAQEHFREALQINPVSVKYLNDAGVALERQGKLKEAAQLYEATLKIGPNPVVLNNLAGILARQGQIDQAIERFRQAIAVAPKEHEIHFNLGNVLARKGQIAEAAEAYKTAILLYPNYPEAFHNLGRVTAAQGQLEKAAGYFRQALQLQPDFVDARRSLEMALAEMGQPR